MIVSPTTYWCLVAQLRLVGGTLSIQDTSVNGTWVNEHRLANGIRVELHTFDKVSFLPAGHPGCSQGPDAGCRMHLRPEAWG